MTEYRKKFSFILCIIYQYNYNHCEFMCLNTAHHPEIPYLSVSEDTIYFVAHFIPHVDICWV